ncbi:beta-ketoacyl-[acyl-carrier-protein] synthase family protein [Actinophytocola sp.]|uniref:beta-ketoacyl-[acyl-carrier-protein] synthase family protein n=1 Tax=Actinophytocola sp. TaxID=1872138 RepID=UPI002D49F12E|nr:beta-ketoacyl-[acyl-carrier-protein] synthase family protein [Actinophytocola sp.]HYQ63940.1 beta-ketoacyl-[acyl-carrier-protein] synthase family protein [Actinophytocola sp.]
MSARRRVVVTGLGTVNSVGTSVPEFWRRSVAGHSGVRRVTEFAIPDDMSQIAGVVADDWAGGEPLSVSLDADPGTVDRSLRFALSATEEAIADAGLHAAGIAALPPGRAAVAVSTAISHITRMEAEFRRGSKEGKQALAVDGARVADDNSFLFNTTNARLAATLGIRADYATVTTGCTGGVDSIGYAMQLIRHENVDLVIAGATEAPITPLVVAAFSKIGATSMRNAEPTRASRPFDVDRDGFVLAEGAGVLVLESLDAALARGARVYAEVLGYGSVNSCFHMTSMPDSGIPIAQACSLAVTDAGVSTMDIDFVNAHGSSTPQNDRAETGAFRLLLGGRATEVPVTSIKSQTGHSLAAANAIELVSSVLSIRDGIIPPTINLDRQDEECGLDVVAGTARRTPVSCVLKTSSGFSGIHSSLVLGRYLEVPA